MNINLGSFKSMVFINLLSISAANYSICPDYGGTFLLSLTSQRNYSVVVTEIFRNFDLKVRKIVFSKWCVGISRFWVFLLTGEFAKPSQFLIQKERLVSWKSVTGDSVVQEEVGVEVTSGIDISVYLGKIAVIFWLELVAVYVFAAEVTRKIIINHRSTFSRTTRWPCRPLSPTLVW